MDAGDVSTAADAEQILVTPDDDEEEDEEEEDEEDRLKNQQELQNILADAFESEEESEYEDGERGSFYEQSSFQYSQSGENLGEYRSDLQQKPVDESADSASKLYSNEAPEHEDSRSEFKDFHGDGNWRKDVYPNRDSVENGEIEEQDSRGNSENENSKFQAYFRRNQENQEFSEDGDARDELQPNALMAAKDRQIANLRQELADRTYKWEMEIAALGNQLAETTEAKENVASELEVCKHTFNMANMAGMKMQEDMEMLQSNFEALRENKDQVVLKLKLAEDTKDSLSKQLQEFQRSESMIRMRENHSKAMNNVEENYKKEILKLNVEVGELREAVRYKEEEVTNLSERLDEVRSELETVKQERIKTVNKLFKDLQVSQENYQKLLKSKGNERVSEDHNLLVFHLKEELTSVKQELENYRSASKLCPVPSSNHVGKTASDGLPAYSPEVLMSSLKEELNRLLPSLSAKNDELKKMRSDLQSSEAQAKLSREQNLKNERSLADYQEKVQELTKELSMLKLASEASSSSSSKDVRALQTEKETLKTELRKSKQRVEELSALNEEMNEVEGKMRKEMLKMSQKHERDVKECKEHYQKLHSEKIQLERDQATKSLQDQQQQQHELRIKRLVDELTEVKQLYVEVCKEKDKISERLKAEWEVEKKTLKEKWDEETKASKREISEDFSKQVAQKVKQAKQLWEKEQSSKMEENVLAKAKELLQHYQTEKSSDSAEKDIEDYLDHIKELETRVKETEEAFREHLRGCESSGERQRVKERDELEAKLRAEHELVLRDATMALRSKFEREKQSLKAALSAENTLKRLLESSEVQWKDMNAALENQKEEMEKTYKEREQTERIKLITEINLENQKVMQDKLQKLKQELSKEKTQALADQETHLCQELENFLVAQKQRFTDALNVMQESHSKEKTELRKYYEEIVSRLKAECQQRLEAKDSDVKRLNRDALGKYEDERSSLLKNIESLKDKCARLESDKTSLASKIQLELKTTKLELEECRSKLEQNEADWAGRREELVVNPLRKEIAGLRAKAKSAEDCASQLRLELDKSTLECKSISDKYVILKEKVKKYHRYVHGKEKEYTESVLKMNAEHKLSIDKIATMRDAAEAVEQRFQEIYKMVKEGSSNGPRTPTPNSKMFAQTPHVNESENEMLRATIERFHGDMMKFIKLQEEMTKASMSFYESLKGMSNGAAPPPPHLVSKQTWVDGGSAANTPEPHTNGSSGRGTMVGNSAGSASDGNERYRTQPLKFWSSTPFLPSEPAARFDLAPTKTPVTPFLEPRLVHEVSDEWPPRTNSRHRTEREASRVDGFESDGARFDKLEMLTKQILGSRAGSFNTLSRTNLKPVEHNRKVSSTSELAAMKNEFWKSVNGK